MTRGPLRVAALAVALGLGVAGVAASQDEPPSDREAAPEAAKAPLLPKPEDFKPGFDDLMTMLVQPRHLKLQYAGTKRNWELAAAESRNLRQAFGRISRTLPDYLGIDVAEAMEAMMTPQLQAVDAAVTAADPAKFASAYDGLTKACNACHVYMERPYIVVKVPDPAAPPVYAGQDFSAPP
jgi:hypothetical protein